MCFKEAHDFSRREYYKDREKTLHNLKLASNYIGNYWNEARYYPAFLVTPEFSEVKEDPEFLKVLGRN